MKTKTIDPVRIIMRAIDTMSSTRVRPAERCLRTTMLPSARPPLEPGGSAVRVVV
jgi:hypothetical protein